MKAPDPRLTLARAGLADARLEGITAAARYETTTPLRCIAPATALRRDPAPGGEQRDQLLYGEMFDVLEEAGGWAWGQARRDGYVGFVERAALGEVGPAPTHRVAALRAYVYAAPDVTSSASGPFSINSLVRIAERSERFVRVPALSGWMALRHLTPIGLAEPDFVAVAEHFVGAAYLWGGREAQGVDCSGLVQQALMAAGRACPRDADLQQAMGREVEAASLGRGDLVFWAGHVAVMIDDARIVHANGYHAAVAIEPLVQAITRIDAAGAGQPIAYRRLG